MTSSTMEKPGAAPVLPSSASTPTLGILGGGQLGRMTALALVFVISGCWPGPPEDYLIPDGYIGPIVVAFEQQDGQPVERNGGTLVFRIPSSGVLKTQAEFPEGFREVNYFYVNGEGQRSPLPYHTVATDLPEDSTQIFSVRSGYLGELVDPPGDTLIVYGDWSTDTRSPSIRFLVGRRSDWKRLGAQRDSLVQSITRTIITKTAP